MSFNRRSFLRTAPLAAAGLLACSKKDLEKDTKPAEGGAPSSKLALQYPYTEKLIHRPEDGQLPDKVVNSGCSFCPANCRHLVHVKEGRAYNVYGEPNDPVQRGKLCAKGQAIPQLLYNKHRLTKPLKRVGPKPSAKFEPISWDQAYKEIASKLIEIRDKSGAKSVAAKASGRQTRESGAMQKRFFELFGSPNTTHEGYICNDSGGIALSLTFGNGGQTNGYGPDSITKTEDLGDSKFIMWFGTNDAECHPVLHGYMKERKLKANTKRVQEALSKLELFVSLNLFPQEDTEYADYILPTTTFYEVDHVGVRRCDRGIRWRNKVVEPVGESRVDSRIWIELGQKMAELDKKNPPEYWKGNLKTDWINTRELWNKVSPANNRTAAGMTADRMDKMATPLRWPCPSLDHPGTSVMYLDRPEWRDIFGGKRFLTPSGKVEIFTPDLQKRLEVTGHSAIPDFYTSPETMDGLPTLEYTQEFVKSPTVANTEGGNLVHKVKIGVKPKDELRKKYPFQLITGRPNALQFHTITQWAWHLVQSSGDRYAQIHPDLAKQMNVVSGDFVKVETPRGIIEGPALVWDGIQPNTIFIPITFAPKQVVRKEVDREVWESVNMLTNDMYYDPLSGQVEYKAQLCNISSLPGKTIYKIGHPLEELKASGQAQPGESKGDSGEGKKG